jgi:hypothetical protein
MRSAAREVLSTPSCRLNAEARAKALAGIDGAANAVDEIAKLSVRQNCVVGPLDPFAHAAGRR